MQIQEHVPLAPLTTFGIGGPARHFAFVQDIQEMHEAFAFAKAKELPVCILGGGSNVLIDDNGFNGLVIQPALLGVDWQVDGEHTLVTAAAGESWDALVAQTVAKNLWGLENLSGIPGTVGGAVVQNIGAYGAALSQRLEWAEVFDTESGEIRRLSNNACAFGYRDSFFKHDGGRHVVVRAAFTLSALPTPDLSYKDLAQRFAGMTPQIDEIRRAVLEVRSAKFPDLTIEGTAGSFFKNPVLPAPVAQALLTRYPDMPLFSLPESSGTKVPLAWLLDHALQIRGLHVGRARLFEKQPLVIVAEKGSSSNDVKKLAAMVMQTVKEKVGIEIEAEVRIIS